MGEPKLLDVTVERSKWYRGQGDEQSRLLVTVHDDSEQNGKMCCLGFVCLAAGLTPDDIANRPFPAEVRNQLPIVRQFPQVLEPLLYVAGDLQAANSTHCNDIGSVNDSEDMPDTEREATLTKLGKEVGINFTFVD